MAVAPTEGEDEVLFQIYPRSLNLFKAQQVSNTSGSLNIELCHLCVTNYPVQLHVVRQRLLLAKFEASLQSSL